MGFISFLQDLVYRKSAFSYVGKEDGRFQSLGRRSEAFDSKTVNQLASVTGANRLADAVFNANLTKSNRTIEQQHGPFFLNLKSQIASGREETELLLSFNSKRSRLLHDWYTEISSMGLVAERQAARQDWEIRKLEIKNAFASLSTDIPTLLKGMRLTLDLLKQSGKNWESSKQSFLKNIIEIREEIKINEQNILVLQQASRKVGSVRTDLLSENKDRLKVLRNSVESIHRNNMNIIVFQKELAKLEDALKEAQNGIDELGVNPDTFIRRIKIILDNLWGVFKKIGNVLTTVIKNLWTVTIEVPEYDIDTASAKLYFTELEKAHKQLTSIEYHILNEMNEIQKQIPSLNVRFRTALEGSYRPNIEKIS